MKVYVAAKFEEAPRAQKVMRELRLLGHEVTYDWTQHKPDTPIENLPVIAALDILGAVDAHVVVALWHPNLRGALVEVGAALAVRRVVLAVGVPEDDPCIFWKHPGVLRVESDAALIERFKP